MKFSVEENASQCTAHASRSCFFLSFPVNLCIPPSISGTHVSLRASLLLCLPLCFWQTYQHSTNTASHTHAVLCKLNLHPNSTDRLVCGHMIWQAWMEQSKTLETPSLQETNCSCWHIPQLKHHMPTLTAQPLWTSERKHDECYFKTGTLEEH